MSLDFCAGLGRNKDEVEYAQIQPKTRALLDDYFELCNYGSCSEGLAAMYAYEKQVPQVAMEKIHGLKAFYGIDSPQTLQFFEVHSILDEDHSEREAQGIVSLTDRESEPHIEKALQSALDAWWVFLDGVQEQRSPKGLVALNQN